MVMDSAQRLRRREAMRRGVGAVSLTGLALASGRDAFASAPAIARPTIELVVELNWEGNGNFPGLVQALADQFIADHWTVRHPGVRVTTLPGDGANGNVHESAGSTVAAILAGAGPDIVSPCQAIESFYSQGLLRPLDPYVKADNIDLSVYPADILSTMTFNGTLYGLPDTLMPHTLFVNLSMLDALGVAYPEPDWTYTQATDLWRSIAGNVNKQWLYGARLGLDSQSGGSISWLMHAFGGSVRSDDGTRCAMDSPQALQAFQWLMPLIQAKVAEPGWPGWAGTSSVFQTAPSYGIAGYAVSAHAAGLQWTFFPYPVFPAGRSTMLLSCMYGMNASSKNPPDLVWDFMKFITVEPAWQRYFNSQLALSTPNQTTAELWDYWLRVATATAPPLRSAHLEYFREATAYGWSWATFRYEDGQAQNIINSYVNKMITRQMSVEQAAAEMTRQINALEVAGAAVAAQAAQAAAADLVYTARARQSTAPIQYPVPSVAGAGTPPTDAAALVQVRPSGTVVVRGAGAGVSGPSDAGSFACAPFTESRGSLVCRVLSISPPKGGAVANGARIGLMARQTLGASSTEVGLLISAGKGVHYEARTLAYSNIMDQGDPRQKWPDPAGLLTAAQILSPSASAANLLLHPVWLRLTLDVATWTAYTSLDGSHWLQAGEPVTVDWVGSWVGLFVSSHQPGHPIAAAFDQLSGFRPTRCMQIGSF
jgi:ABC-type glycerol-3-phosphate transport system substrate-binding protein